MMNGTLVLHKINNKNKTLLQKKLSHKKQCPQIKLTKQCLSRRIATNIKTFCTHQNLSSGKKKKHSNYVFILTLYSN